MILDFLTTMICIIIAYPLWVGLSMWLYAIIETQPIHDGVIETCIFIPIVNIGLTIFLIMYKFYKV